ncbi:hypothetical protein [Bifidobacterium tissieri]|uniref:Peptidoglycan-binding domain 1 protein n=1 Tax=Bifidobacterium tissieri TaxID=1630162 RepID=A0A5M9ZTR8_9BIFI|nr:hypothetical protein [Bifidobacterium tissieri]KAA8831034.1 hypothetical protein EMO89_02985 [Bifidobacterium tissieri]KAA8833311.1 hypothetical protein EM849_01155 [Bifidobacterium tissieri]
MALGNGSGNVNNRKRKLSNFQQRKASRSRQRISITWFLLVIIVTAAIAVGAGSFLLPDRPPQLLSPAREITQAPVSTQQYDGMQQVTVIPTMSSSRQLLGNVAGTVTANWTSTELASGKRAFRVNGRTIVALATASPLYRDMTIEDQGDDVLALNNELNRLGYQASPGSKTFSAYTARGWKQLMLDSGNNSDGTLHLADTLWIPSDVVSITNWRGTTGTSVTAGTAIAEIPGQITRLDIKNGQPSDADRTLTVFGESTTLPAGAISVSDQVFCQRVMSSPQFQTMFRNSSSASAGATGSASGQGDSSSGTAGGGNADLSTGFSASLSLITPIQTLRVPAAAVFGVSDNQGCIVSHGKTLHVTIIGADLGTSLLQLSDGTQPNDISEVSLGSVIAGASCS